MKKERVAKFRRVVEESTGDFVLFNPQVDPDSLGKFGVEQILSQLVEDRTIKIVYCGGISHPQNTAIVGEYGLRERMIHVSNYEPKDTDNLILVDSARENDSRVPSELLPLKPLIAIDHHPSDLPDEDESHFFWVDKEVDAASTLVVELAEALDVEMSIRNATLLALGIYEDTDRLPSTVRDRAAYGRMVELASPDVLKKLVNYELPPRYYELEARASRSVEVHNGYLVAKVGRIDSSGEGDLLAILVDHLISWSGLSMALVWGIDTDVKKAQIKARSSTVNDPDLDLDSKLKEVFGKGVAGARPASHGGISKGGADVDVDLSQWAPRGTEDEQEQLVEKTIHIGVFGLEMAREIKERKRRRRIKRLLSEMLEEEL